MMKKALTVFMASTLALTTGISAASAAPSFDFKSNFTLSVKFKDVSHDDWSLRFVTEMSTKRVISGYEDGTFRPSANVSKEEALIMTIRAMGLSEQAKSLPGEIKLDLPDADAVSTWARPYMQLALTKGLIDAKTTLDPRAHADREWTTEMVVRALGLQAEAEKHMNDTLTFRDAAEIDAEARGYIAVAAEKQIITGYEDRTFKPNKPVKRNELAVILCNAEHLFDYDRDRQEQSAGQLQGAFKGVTGTKLSFISLTGTEVSYELASNHFVFLGNKISTLTDLKAGMWIRVLLNAENRIVFVQGKEAAPDLKEIQQKARGTVSAFVAPTATATGSVTLTMPSSRPGHLEPDQVRANPDLEEALQKDTRTTTERTITLPVAPGATVKQNGVAKAFTDITVGSYVELGILNNTVLAVNVLAR